jgi:hypothetical protein
VIGEVTVQLLDPGLRREDQRNRGLGRDRHSTLTAHSYS